MNSKVMFGINGNIEFVDKTMSFFYDTSKINPKYALDMKFKLYENCINGTYVAKKSEKKILQYLKWIIKGTYMLEEQKAENAMIVSCTFTDNIELDLYSIIDIGSEGIKVQEELDNIVAKGREHILNQNMIEGQ